MHKFNGAYHFRPKELAFIIVCGCISMGIALFLAKRNYIDGFEDALNL